jgi:NitT/TauT family transport system substrate-binding protein
MKPKARGIVALLLIGLIAFFCWRAYIGARRFEDANPSAVKLTATHSIGLCNLALFVAVERQFSDVQLKLIANPGDHAAALTSGTVDVAVTPFSNVISARANGAPIRIIAGSGLNGLYVLGQPEISDWKSLVGKRIGTFRSDTLEVMAYDAMKKAGAKKGDFQFAYFTDPFEFIQAFKSKNLDAITLVEPYVTQLVNGHKAVILDKSEDVWGGRHPDCVLIASDAAIQNKRSALKSLIGALFSAEALIETNPREAVALCARKYYKTSEADILLAANSQPPGIDIRDQRQFILERAHSLIELGYFKNSVDESVFDFSLLSEVIKERPDVYASVAVKAR